MSIEQTSQPMSAEFVQINGINYSGLDNINNDLEVHYLIYKITNITNGMYYIGQHKTRNPTDTYMGSGHYIERAIKKYSHGNFIKEILFDFDNFDDMNNKEKELVPVNECFPNNPMSYNLIEGGNGRLSDEVKKRISETLKSSGKVAGKNNPMFGYHWSEEQRKHQSEVMTGRHVSDEFREGCRIRCSGEGNPMYGKHHTDEAKKKISDAVKQRGGYAGENNPMYKLQCLSEEQKIEWRRKIGLGNKGKKRTEEFKNYLKERAKANPIRRMHHPVTGEIRNVTKDEVQKFLDSGYVMGTGIQSRKGKVGACAGKRIMTSPDGVKRYIKIEDIQSYIDQGWKLSDRSKPIK